MKHFLLSILFLATVSCQSSSPSNPATPESPTPPVQNPQSPIEEVPVTPLPPHADDAYAIDITSKVEKYVRVDGGIVAIPGFDKPEGTKVVDYDDAGDGAIWTGTYLAGESFRYGARQEAEALKNVKSILESIKDLVDVTGTDRLARFLAPNNSEYAGGIKKIEAGHTTVVKQYKGKQYFWIGNNRRDQYLGVLFGLGVTYDFVNNEETRALSKKLITRIVGQLIADNWDIVDADNKIVETFRWRFDHIAALLQLAKHVDPENYTDDYQTYSNKWSSYIPTLMAAEGQENHSKYYKFNLNHMAMYMLMKYEDKTSKPYADYLKGYESLQAAVAGHDNAVFMLVDRMILGPDPKRDAKIKQALVDWRARPRWNYRVDLTGQFAACGDNQACDPIPVKLRPSEGYLWERTPYALWGGGDGRRLLTGIDYIMPYWFARVSRL